MNSEMAFECLLVSPDPALFTVMDGVLKDFSISTKVCPNTSNAPRLLAEGSTDLVVIDLEGEKSSELLGQIRAARKWQKPTVLAVSAKNCVAPGVDVLFASPSLMNLG